MRNSKKSPVSVCETAQGHERRETKNSNNIIQLQFPWFYDSSDQIVFPIQDNAKDSTIAFKELPLSFPGRGEVRERHFTQIKRSCSAYLYEVRVSGAIYYEVFERRQNRLYGNITYPSANAFGVWAWTTPSFKRASEIFDKLSEKGGN